jgi:hypothetical protein
MLNKLIKQGQKYVVDNSPMLLTAFGVVGTVTTAYLAGKASFRASEILAQAEYEATEDLELREKIDLTWRLYVPTVSSGVLTVCAIIGSNYVSTRRAAAMATAYAIAERAFDEYRDKVTERLGEKKEQKIRDEVAQDSVTNNPVSKLEVHGESMGDILCYDLYSGRYFYSDMESLRRIQNDVNHAVLNNMYAPLSDFYDRIGLDRTGYSEEIGWNVDKLLELRFSATISDDGRPCMVVDFATAPIRYFDRLQ